MGEPGRRTGIELDGCTARRIDLVDDRVVGSRTVTGPTPAAALRTALDRRRRRAPGATTVVWTEGVEVHRLALAPAPKPAWRAAMFAAVEDELFVDEDDAAVAGIVASDDAGSHEALVAVTSSAAVDDVWDVVRAERAGLTAAALCHRADDPEAFVELAVRDASAEVTLVHDGRAVAVRSLPDGALDRLLSALHLDRDAAFARLSRVLTGTARIDPEAVEVVDRHVARLAVQTAEQVRAWRQGGLRVGSGVALAGPGGTVPSLPARLQEAGLTAVSASPPTGIDVNEVDAWDRFAYAGAIMAAATPLDPRGVGAFANRRVEADRLRAHDRAVVARRRAVAVGIGLAAAGLLAVPLLWAALAERRAEGRHTTALARFASVAEVDAALHHAAQGRAVYEAQASNDVRWAELQRQVEATLPPAGSVQGERLARTGSSVTVELTAAFAGEPYSSVSGWAQRLRTVGQQPGGRDNAVTIRTFAVDPATRTIRATLVVVVPLRAPFVDRRTLAVPPAQPTGGGS